MDIIKQSLKSRTIIFALALALFGVLETQIHIFSQFMSPEAFGVFNIVVAIAVALLRVITTMPITQK
jgi:hypothetical protein